MNSKHFIRPENDFGFIASAQLEKDGKIEK